MPPPASSSFDDRIGDRFVPVPEPNLNSMPSGPRQRQDRIHRVLDRIDEAGRALRRLLEAAIKPDRAVERRLLIHQDMLQIVAERLQVRVAREILACLRPRCDGSDDAANQLLDAVLAFRRADLPTEIF